MAAVKTLTLLLLQIIVALLFCESQARTSRCGGRLIINKNIRGPFEIKSPNYPRRYGNNVLCEWNFVPSFPADEQVADLLLIVSFSGRVDIKSRRRCRADYLEIRAGSKSGHPLARICGNRSVQPVQHNGPLYIKFQSNRRGSGRGFKATISVNMAVMGSAQTVSAPVSAPARAAAPSATQPRTARSRSDQMGSEVLYTRWGKPSCPHSGRVVYTGIAAGFSTTGTSSLRCVKSTATFSGADITSNNIPSLSAAEFSLQGVTGGLASNLDTKGISCTVCNVPSGNEKLTLTGADSCSGLSDFTTAYSGYLMSVWFGSSTTQPSSTICMDSQPELNAVIGGSQTPELRYVKSGRGPSWASNKLIRCAVCIKLP